MRKIWAIALILFISILTAYVIFQVSQSNLFIMKGTMFVSDAGRSHGGFEYNAEWNATLTVKGSSGILNFTLNVGLGDALQKHEYNVSDFNRDQNRISLKIDGNQVVLIWVEQDEIWDHAYDKHYIASWGSDSPPDEIIGTISPNMFLGLFPSYYVELRLK